MNKIFVAGQISFFFTINLCDYVNRNLALIGFPTLSGYYSKDLLLETLLHYQLMEHLYLFSYNCSNADIIYSMRLIYCVFFNHQASFFKGQFSSIQDHHSLC